MKTRCPKIISGMALATASEKVLEDSQCLTSSFTRALLASWAKATWQASAQSAAKAILFIVKYPGL